jgi:hypothetical protein
VQEQILETHPDADLLVYVVWLPVLPLDARFEVADVMVDPRAAHFWDNEQLVSDDLGRTFGFQGTVWDAFFSYGPDAVWDDRLPEPLSTGAPVVDAIGSLEASLRPYLE